MSAARQVFAVLALGLAACRASSGDPGTDTNTNWVKSCERDDQCAGQTSCECGICTLSCRGDADCRGLATDAVCSPAPRECTGFASVCSVRGGSFEDPDDGDAGSSPPSRYEARPSWTVFEFDRVGRQVRVGEDGAIVVVGGQGRTVADLSINFPNYWLAKFAPSGELDWERIEPNSTGDRSNGLSLALLPDGSIVTVTTIYDGSDTPVLRRHDASGASLGEFSVEPGITRLATNPSGELLAAGSNLIEFRNGRPFTEGWMGALRDDAVDWAVTRRGVEGSVSKVWDIVPTSEGYLVVGALGTAASSNAATAWLGKGRAGEPDLEWEVAREDGAGQSGWSVAATPDGGVVIAGTTDGPIVARYDGDGRAEWDRRLERYPAALAAVERGYAIGYAGRATSGTGEDTGRIDFFDWDGALVWTLEDSACQAVVDVTVFETDFVALFECSSSLGLYRIPIDQTAAGLGGVGLGTPTLRACSSDADCEMGRVCESGTCAQVCTATEQCPQGHRCVQPFTDQGECPYLGPGEPGKPGACLPRCYEHEQCASVAAGLSCRNGSCVIDVPECESRCWRLAGGCAEGCSEIRGRGVDPELGCAAAEAQLLGCYPEGRSSTTEDGCVKSADGAVYSAGGLYAASLILSFGFSECSPEDQELLGAPTCE